MDPIITTFHDLITNYHWLSIEAELLRLYPDQRAQIDAYQEVYKQLLSLTPEESGIAIRLIEVNEDDESYVDVDGYYEDGRVAEDKLTDALALDFTPWEQWLGMKVDPNAFREFTDLEIVAHCLFEMTFISFDPDERKTQLKSMKKTVEFYKKMTPEERKRNTISLDELLDELGNEES